MSFQCEVLGKISVEQRSPGEDTANWLIKIECMPTHKEAQSLINLTGTIGGIEDIKQVRPGIFAITVLTTTTEDEAALLKHLIERFINVIDGAALQQRTTQLAEHSTVPVYGHFYQD